MADEVLTRRCCCHPLIEEPNPGCKAHSVEPDPREFRRGWDAAVRGESRPDWRSPQWLAGYDDLLRERAKDTIATKPIEGGPSC